MGCGRSKPAAVGVAEPDAVAEENHEKIDDAGALEKDDADSLEGLQAKRTSAIDGYFSKRLRLGTEKGVELTRRIALESSADDQTALRKEKDA